VWGGGGGGWVALFITNQPNNAPHQTTNQNPPTTTTTQGDEARAREALAEMRRGYGIDPDVISYTTVIQACGRVRACCTLLLLGWGYMYGSCLYECVERSVCVMCAFVPHVD
jgi:hypothetical protein